ncbi:MAG: hypothetical protein ACREQY_01815, partial [Candidatus Binatia bacterium]
MLPAVAAAAGFLRFLSLALVLGASALPLFPTAPGPALLARALGRRPLVAASLVALAAGFVELAARSADLLDLASGSGSPWWALVARTRLGKVWLGEQTAVLVLLALLGIRFDRGWIAAVATVSLLLGPLASHSAGLDDPVLAMAVHALHL